MEQRTNINLVPSQSESIEITLSDGQRYSLRDKETLGEINEEQEAIFLFDNGQIYHGQSDGQVDEEGDFPLFKTDSKHGIALPFARLVGWVYRQEPKDPLTATREMLGRIAEQVSQDFGIDLLSRPIQKGRGRTPDRNYPQLSGAGKDRIRERKPSD